MDLFGWEKEKVEFVAYCKFEKRPNIFTKLWKNEYFEDISFVQDTYTSELGFNDLYMRTHRGDFIGEWIEKFYNDWKTKVLPVSEKSQVITNNLINMFYVIARINQGFVKNLIKSQDFILIFDYFIDCTPKKQNKLCYQLAYVLFSSLFFENVYVIDSQNQRLFLSKGKIKYTDCKKNDLDGRKKLINLYRKNVHLKRCGFLIDRKYSFVENY